MYGYSGYKTILPLQETSPAEGGCFANLVGFRGLCDAGYGDPESGIFVDDIEGIDLEFASDAASGENDTGAALIESKMRLAERQMINDLTGKLQKKVNMKSYAGQMSVGCFSENYETPAAHYRGIYAKQRRKTQLSRLVIENIGVLVGEDVETTLIIQDGREKTEIDLQLMAGQEFAFAINYIASSPEVFILLKDVCSNVSKADCEQDICCGKQGFERELLMVAGWDGSGTSNQTFGLRADLAIQCFSADFFCRFKYSFADLYAYRVAIELANEALYTTNRLNFLTVTNEEGVRVFRDHLQKRYSELLDNATQRIYPTLRSYDSACIECTGIRYHNVI